MATLGFSFFFPEAVGLQDCALFRLTLQKFCLSSPQPLKKAGEVPRGVAAHPACSLTRDFSEVPPRRRSQDLHPVEKGEGESR